MKTRITLLAAMASLLASGSLFAQPAPAAGGSQPTASAPAAPAPTGAEKKDKKMKKARKARKEKKEKAAAPATK